MVFEGMVKPLKAFGKASCLVEEDVVAGRDNQDRRQRPQCRTSTVAADRHLRGVAPLLRGILLEIGKSPRAVVERSGKGKAGDVDAERANASVLLISFIICLLYTSDAADE